MGSPKALLPDQNGCPFVLRIVTTLLDGGLRDVCVVTGSQHTALVDVVGRAGLPSNVRLARNEDPARGQLSSLLTGLDACDSAELMGLMVTLVDVPMVSVDTVRRVREAWETTRAPIVRPAVGVRRGHPVVFDRAVFAALRATPLSEGARPVVRAYEPRSTLVEVDDPGCLVDVDTPADYEAMRQRSPS